MTEPAASIILGELSKFGLLLKQDKRIPNVVSLITRESLSASWWSHPKGRLIFRILSELSGHPDVLFIKLLHRKVTLVHRMLWPAVLAVAESGEPWQMRGLQPQERALLRKVKRSKEAVLCSGKSVKELEFRMLAHTNEIHTETGRHATVLEPWSAWRDRTGIQPLETASLGREQLEKAARAIGAPLSSLPWRRAGGA